MLAAGSHHTVLTTAAPLGAIDTLARMTSSELVVIDAGTTIPRLRMDLQAGAAYHRLAAGLVGGQ